MRYLFVLLILSLSSCGGMAAKSGEYTLKPVSPEAFEKLSSVVQHSIKNEDTKIEIQPFDIAQTFSLVNRGKQKGFFMPVKFNSKQYNNTICRLYFVDTDMHTKQVDLLAEKSEDGEIVPSCIGVESLSIKKTDINSLLVLTIVRYRLANQYSSVGKVVNFENEAQKNIFSLNSCIGLNNNISNMQELKRKADACQSR